MSDEPEVIDGQVEPSPELREAVDEHLPAMNLAVSDPSDQHELMVRMDDHDVAMLLQEIQGAALRKWVYDLKGSRGQGLTIHAAQDIVQRLNWTGKCKIGLLLDVNGRPVVEVETVMADEGNGEEPFYVATTYAKDEITGMVLPGSSMEPQRMKLKDSTAAAKRREGQRIPEDNKVFDRFARWKAIQKATRNALLSFVPEEIEQTVIAMFVKDPSRVQRIQTEAEAKVAEMPAPLDDDRAKELISEAQAVYDRIRELGGGQGKVKLTPGTFSSWMLRSQHDHGALERFVAYLREREEQIPVELEREAQEREALDSAVKVECPKCGVQPRDFCKGIRGSHGERIQARLEQIRGAS